MRELLLSRSALIGATNWSRAAARHAMAWLTASNLRESRRHLYYNFCIEEAGKGLSWGELVINKLQLVKVASLFAPGHVQVLSAGTLNYFNPIICNPGTSLVAPSPGYSSTVPSPAWPLCPNAYGALALPDITFPVQDLWTCNWLNVTMHYLANDTVQISGGSIKQSVGHLAVTFAHNK